MLRSRSSLTRRSSFPRRGLPRDRSRGAAGEEDPAAEEVAGGAGVHAAADLDAVAREEEEAAGEVSVAAGALAGEDLGAAAEEEEDVVLDEAGIDLRSFPCSFPAFVDFLFFVLDLFVVESAE